MGKGEEGAAGDEKDARAKAAAKGPRRPGLLIEFPAERPCYPLLPTRAYGRSVIPIRLYLAGRYGPVPDASLPPIEVDLVRAGLPASLALAEAVEARLGSPWVFAALVLGLQALLSYLAGGLSGLCVARRWHPFAVFGLWNLATLLGLWIATRKARGGRGRSTSAPRRRSPCSTWA